MANDLHRSILSNPMLLWTDLGLRALDMTLSSSHNMCDGIDRLARAAASDRAVIKGAARRSAVPARTPDAAPAPAAVTAPAAGFESSGLNLMTQGWVQWMSTLGTVASLGAGLGMRRLATREEFAPHEMVKSLPVMPAEAHAMAKTSPSKPAARRQRPRADHPATPEAAEPRAGSNSAAPRSTPRPIAFRPRTAGAPKLQRPAAWDC